MSDAWGPRAHPERCEEWAEQDAIKRRVDRNASLIMWSVLVACGLVALWWW